MQGLANLLPLCLAPHAIAHPLASFGQADHHAHFAPVGQARGWIGPALEASAVGQQGLRLRIGKVPLAGVRLGHPAVGGTFGHGDFAGGGEMGAAAPVALFTHHFHDDALQFAGLGRPALQPQNRAEGHEDFAASVATEPAQAQHDGPNAGAQAALLAVFQFEAVVTTRAGMARLGVPGDVGQGQAFVHEFENQTQDRGQTVLGHAGAEREDQFVEAEAFVGGCGQRSSAAISCGMGWAVVGFGLL